VTAARWALHPVTLALALLAGSAGAVATGGVATAPLLAVAAGLAAGFANSGST
jgi:hypothetical protein